MSASRIYTFSVVIIGKENIGKTSLINKLHNTSIPIKSTICANFSTYNTTAENKLQLWDTSGSERYLSLISTYLNQGHAVIICVNLSQQDGDSIDQWVKIAKTKTVAHSNTDKPKTFMLLNLQADAGEAEKILLETKAKEHSIDLYFTVDIEKNINVQEAFQALEIKLLEKQPKASNISSSSSLVQQMERIYNALFDGQTTSFKKVSHWEDIIKDANDPEEQLQKIKEHAEKAPHSRTAQAVKLQKKYPEWHDHEEERKNLIIAIYDQTHEKSGLFKKPARDFENQSLSEIEQLAEAKPHSRLGKIVSRLGFATNPESSEEKTINPTTTPNI